MGKCPFCKGEVAEDLIVFGGPCPHCFNEIPGEEAATDPGAALRAKEKAAEATRARRQQIITAAVAALMLLAAGAGYAWYAKKKAEEEAILYVEFTDADFSAFQLPEEEWRKLYEKPPDEPDGTIATAPKTNGKGTTGGKTGPKQAGIAPPPDGTGPDFGNLEGPADPTPTPSGATGGPSLTPLATGSGGISAGPSTRVNRDVVLKTDDEIFAHIRARMRVNHRSIVKCYNDVLKLQPEYAGSYTLNFTVEKDGTVSKASVTGQGLDPGFESCVVATVQRWEFSKLAKQAPVKYPLNLTPGM